MLPIWWTVWLQSSSGQGLPSWAQLIDLIATELDYPEDERQALQSLNPLEAASVLGTSASLHVAFGLIGAVLTDAVGVRRVALTALSISVVGRGLLAFGRSRTAIHAAFYLFSPAGEALLATGLYRVALKKLTTPKTRAFAFAVEYATFNLSGALADVCIDAFRRRGDVTLGDQVLTPTRQFLLLTFFVVCASWLLVALYNYLNTSISSKVQPVN